MGSVGKGATPGQLTTSHALYDTVRCTQFVRRSAMRLAPPCTRFPAPTCSGVKPYWSGSVRGSLTGF